MVSLRCFLSSLTHQRLPCQEPAAQTRPSLLIHYLRMRLLVLLFLCVAVVSAYNKAYCPPVDPNIHCIWFNEKCSESKPCGYLQRCCPVPCGTECLSLL
ncbi:hypothetical protein O3P69_015919 [Scylla paramamosain]|uniref:WAP domain-containing protein n=1 Tax=Scylla paramamosain TaxID=85552 RepID=A0AAW0T887_SCYPA